MRTRPIRRSLTLIVLAGCAGTGTTSAGTSAVAAVDPWLGPRATAFQRPGFASGARIAVLHGNPADTGYFVLRLGLPDGYAIPPHWHPTTEFVTVLQGTFLFGMGERADRAQVRALPVGSLAAVPERMPHFAFADGATVVQVHGRGPFQLNLVAPVP